MLIKYNSTKSLKLSWLYLYWFFFFFFLLPLQISTYSNMNSRITMSFLTIMTNFLFNCHIVKRSPLLISNIKFIQRCTIYAILFMLIIFFLMPAPVHSQPLGILSRDEQQNVPNRRYCSAALFEAIRLICNGRYNSLSNKYRMFLF